jgi:hypothetical protein
LSLGAVLLASVVIAPILLASVVVATVLLAAALCLSVATAIVALAVILGEGKSAQSQRHRHDGGNDCFTFHFELHWLIAVKDSLTKR